MDGDIVEQVTSWNSKPFDGGFDTLNDLATDEFSGAVTSGQAWLFFLNGNVVGVFDGSIDDFGGGDGTVYDAPGMALPLLFAMRERGGEQKAQYYTEDTPLSEVDATLSDSNFTGYIELSENVLSGDYYVAYYGGRSLAAAFVGNQAEVLTGDDAFERAADEVGIYEVRTVPIDVVDIPEPESDDTAVGGVVTEAESEPDDDASQAPDTDPTPTTEDLDESLDASDSEPTETTAEATDASTDPPTPAADDTGTTSQSDEPTASTEVPSESTTTQPTTETGDREERFDDEAEWRETRTIPSLSPSESDTQDTPDPTPTPPSNADSEASSSPSDPDEELSKREAELEELESRIETLAAERDRAQTERDDLEEELQAVRQERQRLADRVDELESQLDDDTAPTTGGGGQTGRGMAPDDALADTNLFIRYGSRGDATLDAVADGISPEEVHNNLQLDVHTQFDAGDVTVDGDSFDVFLEESPEYAFVEWVVRELPFEIRETNHESKLIDLYGAIPQIDRAQFRGSVSAQTEDGEVRAEYDVILRDKKGEPLIVASINDSRDPVTGDMMTAFIEDTTTVARECPEIGAAMSVTASFFKPGALEAAEDATGGGFLSRDSRVSFVRTSRKQGYHLCLVESRKGSFHVNIPEL